MDNESTGQEIVKLIPPVGVSTLSLLGVPISDLVCVLTLMYIAVNIVCTISRTYYQIKGKKDEK